MNNPNTPITNALLGTGPLPVTSSWADELLKSHEKLELELHEARQLLQTGGPISSEYMTLDALLDELNKAKAVASGRTCVSFVHLSWGASSLWHRTHMENFRKIDQKPRELSEYVDRMENCVRDDFPTQVLDLIKRLVSERDSLIQVAKAAYFSLHVLRNVMSALHARNAIFTDGRIAINHLKESLAALPDKLRKQIIPTRPRPPAPGTPSPSNPPAPATNTAA